MKGKHITLVEVMQYNVYVPHNQVEPMKIRYAMRKNTQRLNIIGSITEVKHLKEPHLERSGTCRFAAQGQPDYLTACVVSKAIHFLVIKPVSSCLLQLSGKE